MTGRTADNDAPTVHVVTWGNYVQGVFDSADEAQAYVDHRWPVEARFSVRVDLWQINVGAFDTRVLPLDEQQDPGKKVECD